MNSTAENESKIIMCYRYFTDHINSSDGEVLFRILSRLLNDEVQMLVIIELDSNDDEQHIFDTINSTGEKLTAADIIKNALFHTIQGDDNIDGIYQQYWQECFEKNNEVVSKWLCTKGTGQNQRTFIDSFFYCFAVIKGFFDVKNDKLANLAQKYKEHIQDFDHDANVSFIMEVYEYGKVYWETFIGFDALTAYSFSDDKSRLLHILSESKIYAFDSIILYALKNYDADKQSKIFNNIERYVVRHFIIGTSEKKSFADNAAKMINNTFDFEVELKDDSISDERFEDSLKDLSNNNAKLLLFWVELYKQSISNRNDLSKVFLPYSFELEHILPVKWEDKWSNNLPQKDEDGNLISKDQAIANRNKVKNQLGNMTLLTASLNRAIKNGSFKDKVNGNGKYPGYKDCSALSITTEIIEENDWNEKTIIERTKKLFDLIKKIWPANAVS